MKRLRSAAALLALLLFVSRPALAEGPTVLAAASLQDVLTEIAEAWAEEGREAPVLSFAASSTISRQVAAGAPADLVVTADREWMDWLEARNLVDADSRRNMARNRLVVAARSGAWIGTSRALVEALGNGRLAIADPDGVPAGRYAKTALTRLGVWKSVEHRLAVADNVRGALALLERGAVPLAILYESDAKASQRVLVTGRFSPRAHPPIVYPAARLTASESEEADAFLAFLTGPRTRAVFRAHGFGVSDRGDAE